MLKLDDLRSAVNLYRGAAQFSLPLASLPGASDAGYALTLSYDSGRVDETVVNWNLSHPTGLAGLGWKLETSSISIDYGDAFGSDQAVGKPTIRLHLDGEAYQLIQTGTNSNVHTYATEPYQFWNITYTPITETWVVILENGSQLTFGDLASGRDTVDWGYVWNNWLGASVNPTQRTKDACGWSLAQMADVWGNSYLFTYTQTSGTLGSNPAVSYTQATYLTGIDGPSGGSLVLHYADKLPAEYQNPQSGPDAAAWQSHFATKVLASIDEVSSGGTILTVTTLEYLGTGGMVATIGTGDRTKRLLMGIARRAPAGYNLPDMRFTYEEDSTATAYGALLSVTTPAGGTAVFTYQRPALTLPRRDQILTVPVKVGVTYDTPRIFFGQNSTVVLWHGSDASVAARVYQWEGRWLATDVVAATASDLTAYNQLRVPVSSDCFAIVGATNYTLFHTDPHLAGAWIGSTAPEPLGLPSAETVALTAGPTYLALLATQSGTMIMRWFDGAAWQTLNVPGPAGTQVAALDGTSDIVLRISSTEAGSSHDLLLMQSDPTLGWTTRLLRLTAWVSALDSLAITAGETFAVVTLMGWSGPNRTFTYMVFWWDVNGQSIQSTLLKTVSLVPPATAPAVQVRGAALLIDQDIYRFNGVTWQHQNLALLTHPNQQSVTQLTLGADIVTRTVQLTTNAIIYDTLTYNAADAGATPWSYAAGMNGVPAKTGTLTTAMTARFDPGEPGEGSRFLLFNNQLYELSGDGTWGSLLDISNAFTASTIPSLQLFADTYLIYQTASAVEAYPLRGGGLAADSGIALSNAQLLTTSNQPLAGATAFVAYTGTWGQVGAVLTLYRPVAGDVRNALTPLLVTQVTLYGSGLPATIGTLPYNAVSYMYTYDGGTATVSGDGYHMAANKATLAAGTTSTTLSPYGYIATYFFNGLSAAEAPAWPYPTESGYTNAVGNVMYLEGVPYAEFAFAVNQSTSASAEIACWWVTTVRNNARSIVAYWRCRKVAQSTDAVPSAKTMTYSSDTGLLTQIAVTTADGHVIQTSYTYWWEKYDPTRVLNLLTPVVQCMQYADTVLTRGVVITWTNDWGTGSNQWAPSTTYMATSATPAPFTTWTGIPNPLPAGWVLTDEISARSAISTVQTTIDALGQKSSSLTSQNGFRQIASFANADIFGQEAYYYGFESYEDAGPWFYQGGTIAEHLVVGEANLGTLSLEIAPDTVSQTGPTATWVPLGQTRSFLFSCWVQTSLNFGTIPGDTQFKVVIYTVANPPQAVGTPLLLPVPATSGTWQYVSIPIPLGTIRAANSIPTATKTSITVSGYNQKAGTQVLVDGLRFQPVDATFFAEVFDPATNLPLGSLEPNGGTYHLIRDENHVVTATVGPDLSVTRFSIPSFARLLTADQTYSETLPNTDLESSAGSASIYQNFEASDASQWLLPANWSIANGSLTFSGTAAGPIGSKATLKNFTYPNYVAYVRFVPPTSGVQPNVGIGCGNVLVYHDATANNWVLTALIGGVWQNLVSRAGPIQREDLVFSILDGRVSFFAAGQQIFSHVLPSGTTADGTLNLYLTTNGAFQELIALIDPRLRLVMIDGRGIAQQSIDLRDHTQVAANGLVYDALGQPGYEKNAVYTSVAENDNRILGGVANYLPQQQTLANYLLPGNGSPFVQTQFEYSPLARPQQLGLPGNDLAIGGSHATQFAYTQNTAAGPMAGLVPDNQAGNYHLITTTDPDLTSAYALVSPEGEKVAERVKLSVNAALTSGYTYDTTGRLIAVNPPNAYAQNAATGWATTYARDFQGRIITSFSPDSGTTNFAYDSLGRLRFRLDAAGAALSPPRIVYYKYDGLDRIVEMGTLQNAAITWTTVQAQVDVVSWPGTAQTPTLLQQLTYDSWSGALPLTYTEGRITAVSTYKADGTLSVQETYSYDARGNINAYWMTAPDYDATVWLSTYTYDSRNRIVRIDYPRPMTNSQPPLSVIYTYDRLGHITNVGQAPDLISSYGQFTYNADGTLSTASYNNQPAPNVALPISYTYTPASWPLSITSPLYTESVTYESGGYANSGYYDGLVASVTGTWQSTTNSLYPLLSSSALFAYDPAGRMTAATPYIAPPDSQSTTLPIAYDQNGNLLSVQRSAVTDTYSYPVPSNSVTPTNRLQSVSSSLQTTCSFEGAQTPGWTWGATDAGPAGSSVIAGGPQGSTKCLQVPGSVLAMSGYLEYRAPINPDGQYILTYWIKADAAFATQSGDARWCLVFSGPQGPLTTVTVQVLTAVPTTWTQQSTTFDIQSHYTAEAMSTQVTEISILLYNSKRASDGSLGAAIQIDTLSLTGTGTTGQLTYDADGHITSLPGMSLSAMNYDQLSNALVSFQTTTDGGYHIDITQNALGLNTTQSLNTNVQQTRGTSASTALTLYAPNGQPLARLDQQGSTVRYRYFIAGPQDIFAVEDDGQFCYVIRGSDQSIKAVANNQGQLVQYYNYDAFGRVRQAYGGDPVLPTGLESLSGLDLLPGGPYIPALGRDASPKSLPRLEPCEPDPVAPPAGGYADSQFQSLWKRALAPLGSVGRYIDIANNLLSLHFIKGQEYMAHNPDVWYIHAEAVGWNPADWATFGMLLAAPFTINPIKGAFFGLLIYNAPQLVYGIWRFGYIKYDQRSCAARGLSAISNEALAEDIYHFAFYTSPESVGGKRLRHHNVEVIPDGFYIFVVNENNEFLYRDMYDRAGGTELYVRHSMLNGGACAKTAGMFSIFGKKIVMNNKSGHYGPKYETLLQEAYKLLLDAGYTDYTVQLCTFEQKNLTRQMDEYLKARKQA